MVRGEKVVKSFSLSLRSAKWIREIAPDNASAFVNGLIETHWFNTSREMDLRKARLADQHKLQMFGEDV